MPSPTRIAVPKATLPQMFIEKLPNGARIFGVAKPGAQSVDLRVASTVGSLNEPRGKEGLAHLTEHLAFEGTPRRSYSQIRKELADVGGWSNVNAYTENEETVFTATVRNADSRKAAALLVDMYSHPNTSKKAFTKEQRAVQNEMRMKLGATDGIIAAAEAPIVYGDQPHGRDGWGTIKTVGALKPQDVKDWVAQNYTGQNTVAFVAGDPKAMPLATLRRELGKLPAGWRTPEPEEVGYAPGAQVVLAPHKEDNRGKLTFIIPSEGADVDPITGGVLTNVLTDRLDKNLRERTHMSYISEAAIDGDVMRIDTEVDPADIRKATAAVIDTVQGLSRISPKAAIAAKREALITTATQTANPRWATEAAFKTAVEHGDSIPDPELVLNKVRSFKPAALEDAAKQLADFSNMKVFAEGDVAGRLDDIRAGVRDAGEDVRLKAVEPPYGFWREESRTDGPAHQHHHS